MAVASLAMRAPGSRSLRSSFELLMALTSREIRLRYQGSIFGWAWSLVRPLALGIILTFALGKVLGTGLILAAGTATAPLLFGAHALTSTWFEATVPVLGRLEFSTSTVFDVGVYLVVIGMVLDVLRSLGAEVDRQQEDASEELESGSTI